MRERSGPAIAIPLSSHWRESITTIGPQTPFVTVKDQPTRRTPLMVGVGAMSAPPLKNDAPRARVAKVSGILRILSATLVEAGRNSKGQPTGCHSG